MKEVPFTFGSDTWPGLAKLTEEAGETLQIIGKLQATNGENNYWDGLDLFNAIEDELADLLATVEFVMVHNADKIDPVVIEFRKRLKLKRFNDWHKKGDDPRD